MEANEPAGASCGSAAMESRSAAVMVRKSGAGGSGYCREPGFGTTVAEWAAVPVREEEEEGRRRPVWMSITVRYKQCLLRRSF